MNHTSEFLGVGWCRVLHFTRYAWARARAHNATIDQPYTTLHQPPMAPAPSSGDRGLKVQGWSRVDRHFPIFSRGRIKFSDRIEFSALGMVALPPSLRRIGTLGCAGWSE